MKSPQLTTYLMEKDRKPFLYDQGWVKYGLSTILFIVEFLARPTGQEKEIKDIQTGKEEIKLSLTDSSRIVNVEN